MKVLLIANTNSPHVEKWAVALSQQGVEIHLFSIDPALKQEQWRSCLKSHYAPAIKDKFLPRKYKHLLSQLKLRMAAIKPDVMHAHYLSNYASLACLSKFHPLVLTAWGSDVFQYPKQNFLNALLLKWVLRKADCIISTSEMMKQELQLYSSKNIEVIPFGVDFNAYTVGTKSAKANNVLRIGIFKRLEKVYGIDRVIAVLPEVQKLMGTTTIELHLFGNGSQETNLRESSANLKLQERVVFHGWTNPKEVPQALSNIDVCCYVSERESFGVALIEAMAARKALVVSDIPAFRDVTQNYTSVSFVNPFNPQQLTEALVAQLKQSQLTLANDNASVFARFDLQETIKQQIQVYKTLTKVH